MRILFLIFIIVPILEMVLLIKVGGLIGVLPTIALVCLTAFIGVALIRAQGFVTMQNAQKKLAAGQVPGQELIDGASLLVGGAMLLTPGFFTDTIGFLLLAPAFRRVMFHKLLARLLAGNAINGSFHMYSARPSQPRHDEPRVFEGEYRHEEDKK